MQEFPQDDGFADFFAETLTDDEIQSINGGSLVFLDDDERTFGWADMILLGEFGPVVLSPVPPGTKSGDPYPKS